jgi:hypothetical protein
VQKSVVFWFELAVLTSSNGSCQESQRGTQSRHVNSSFVLVGCPDQLKGLLCDT